MSVDNIIARILADAENEAAETKAQAEAKAMELRNKIIKQAQNKVAELTKQADLDVEEVARRQHLIAELENRKSLLAVRRQVLDETFALAEQKLNSLSEEAWAALISKYVLAACETGVEKLCVPSKDQDKYKKYLLSQLNGQLEQQGKQGQLTLAERPAQFSGGVLVIGKDSDYDASFAAILKNVRAEYEKVAADMLFEAEV